MTGVQTCALPILRSLNTYIYNSQTKKLATKDGPKNEEGKSVDGTKRSFSDVAAMKAAEADRNNEIHKKASAVLDSIGSQAPDEVKQAWMEAEKETGAFLQ